MLAATMLCGGVSVATGAGSDATRSFYHLRACGSRFGHAGRSVGAPLASCATHTRVLRRKQAVLEGDLWLQAVLVARRSGEMGFAKDVAEYLLQVLPTLFMFKVSALRVLAGCGSARVDEAVEHVS